MKAWSISKILRPAVPQNFQGSSTVQPHYSMVVEVTATGGWSLTRFKKWDDKDYFRTANCHSKIPLRNMGI
jgi:hypothetical protein